MGFQQGRCDVDSLPRAQSWGVAWSQHLPHLIPWLFQACLQLLPSLIYKHRWFIPRVVFTITLPFKSPSLASVCLPHQIHRLYHWPNFSKCFVSWHFSSRSFRGCGQYQEVKVSINQHASVEGTCKIILVDYTNEGWNLTHLWRGGPWAWAPFWPNWWGPWGGWPWGNIPPGAAAPKGPAGFIIPAREGHEFRRVWKCKERGHKDIRLKMQNRRGRRKNRLEQVLLHTCFNHPAYQCQAVASLFDHHNDRRAEILLTLNRN